MVAYAKYFSRFSLGEPMFSQEFHNERFSHLSLYFFSSKLGKARQAVRHQDVPVLTCSLLLSLVFYGNALLTTIVGSEDGPVKLTRSTEVSLRRAFLIVLL